MAEKSAALTGRRLRLGQRGEQLAARHLAACGYQILAHNYRWRAGEIDLVARHNATLVFVEVRTRSSTTFGVPEESLTPRKRRHLITTAQHYLQAHALEEVNWRIDFVAVELSTQGAVQRITLIENAITAT